MITLRFVALPGYGSRCVTDPEVSSSPPSRAGADRSNALRDRLPVVIVAAAIFVALIVATAVTQNNVLGTVVAVYGIVGGVLLGRLLAKAERARAA
jgi:hypothetical protein